MSRILFVAPDAFPVASSESICNSKVAYALSQAGYKVDVYTSCNSFTYPIDKKLDEYLRKSENLTIYNVVDSKYIVSRRYSLLKNIKNGIRNLIILLRTGYWYNGISVPYSIKNAIEENILKWGKNPYDIVITRGFFTDYVGVYMTQKYHIKWIANWNDPFPVRRFPAPYGSGYDAKLPFLENRLYKKIQECAQIHTFPSERLRKYMLKCFVDVREKQTLVIPHMAHTGLLPIVKLPQINDGIFKIVHCGSVENPRNPEIFIKGLAQMITEQKLTKEDIKCFFVGRYDKKLENLIQKYNLHGIVELMPPMKYADSLGFISTCDMTLIIEAICDEGIYLPTKTVDSIQCGLPIFCVSPSIGTLRDLVETKNVGYFADNTSEECVKKQLFSAYCDFKNNCMPIINSKNADYFFEDNIVSIYQSVLKK